MRFGEKHPPAPMKIRARADVIIANVVYLRRQPAVDEVELRIARVSAEVELVRAIEAAVDQHQFLPWVFAAVVPEHGPVIDFVKRRIPHKTPPARAQEVDVAGHVTV